MILVPVEHHGVVQHPAVEVAPRVRGVKGEDHHPARAGIELAHPDDFRRSAVRALFRGVIGTFSPAHEVAQANGVRGVHSADQHCPRFPKLHGNRAGKVIVTVPGQQQPVHVLRHRVRCDRIGPEIIAANRFIGAG